MQSVSYNQEDIARVNSKLGYITTILFSEGEIVEKAVTGFDAGWKVTHYQNKLFISAVPVEQQSQELEEEYSGDIKRFEPTADQWNTNLFVSTNKRNYSISLNIASANDKHAHLVRYSYPNDSLEAAYLKEAFGKSKSPRNYDYFVKANSNSANIVPDFAYDDGEMSYFGFSQIKQLPSIFLLNNKQEHTSNYSIEQKGNFKIVVVHHLNKAFVLRYGDMAVGILNKSFGKYVKPYSSTISKDVTRVEQKDV